MKLKKGTIKKKIIGSFKDISQGQSTHFDKTYLYMKKLFFELFKRENEREEFKQSKQSIEEKEKAILFQAFLIMKRIYYDPDVEGIFKRDMGNPIKKFIKTDDFLEFIGKLILK